MKSSTAIIVMLAMVATACALEQAEPGTSLSGLPPTVSSTSTAATSSTSSTVGASTTSIPPTTTTTEESAPLGLISPSGIPVAVLDSTPTGFLVMTPCGNEAMLTEGDPIHHTDVIVDPGHGGSIDTGAVGPNGLIEKEVNLQVANLSVGLLRARGIEAVLTRTDDYASPLSVRAHLADSLRASLMVSVHHNAPTPGPSPTPGPEIFIQKDSEESARLGGLLWEHALAELGVFDVAWTAAPDAGVMTVLNSRGNDAYGIIRHPVTTTALIEFGYISNRAEAELFSTPAYVRAAANVVADAVERYLTSDDQGSGHVQGRVFDPSPGLRRDVCEETDLG